MNQVPDKNAIYQRLQTALNLQNSGRLPEALALYEGILQLVPGNGDALNLSGLTLVAMGRPGEGIKRLKKAVRSTPRSAEFLYNLGTVLVSQGHAKAAVEALHKARKIAPGLAEVHNALGNAYSRQGMHKEAVQCYRKAVRLKPEFADAHGNLCNALNGIGDHQGALEAAQRAVELQPGSISAWNNLGYARTNAGDNEGAVEAFQAALRFDPGHPQILSNLARLYFDQHRFERAADYVERALENQPDSPELTLSLAQVKHEEGLSDAAIELYLRAQQLSSTYSAAFLGLATLYAELGRFDGALEQIRNVPVRDQQRAGSLVKAAMIQKYEDGEEAIHSLEKQLLLPKITADQEALLRFGLGKLLDDSQQYARAFQHYRRGNALKFEGYDAAGHQREVDTIRQVFTPAFYQQRVGWGSDSKRPVFIVGMPRSGTTLTEQLLSSHTEVFGAGELPHIPDIVSQLQQGEHNPDRYLEKIAALDRGAVSGLADQYLESIAQSAGDARYVTDKLPGNFMQLGLIRLLFPRAAIIHCLRDPLDTCLSIYFQHFRGSHPYAYDLAALGHYFAQYRKLMDHWARVIEPGMLEVQYEDTVADVKRSARRLLDFCSLDWQDQVLRFYQSSRQVKTASYWQVRQPIYKRSVKRWSHYADELGELRQALGEAAD